MELTGNDAEIRQLGEQNPEVAEELPGLWLFLTDTEAPLIEMRDLDAINRAAAKILIDNGFAEVKNGMLVAKGKTPTETVGEKVEAVLSPEAERVLKGLRKARKHGISAETLKENGLLAAARGLRKTGKVRTGKNPDDGATHYYLIAE